MRFMSRRSTVLPLLAMLAVPAFGGLSAQELRSAQDSITVIGSVPSDLSELAEGPEIEGIISARNRNKVQVTQNDGTGAVFDLSEGTKIRASGGFLGLGRTKLGAESLLNGLPVTVKTVQWGGGLVASDIKFSSNDLDTAAMIRGGTAQQFAQQGAAIDENSAATEALRGRVGDIDEYNIKGVTNVYFDTGQTSLSARAGNDLCVTANDAMAMNNALLLVVGYTDSVGSQESNQILSDKRAGRVVNYLQQECSWKPYRMLTPTGMAESSPTGNNDTEEGKAQNRRVSVNILVSKALDGL